MRIKKLVLGVFSLTSLWAVSSAAMFVFDFSDIVVPFLSYESLSPVAFLVGGNHFPGALFLDESALSSPEIIATDTGETGTCLDKITGFYYNQGRGEIIRPLDADQPLGNIVLNGGIYTNCNGGNYNVDAVMGAMGHEYTSGSITLNFMLSAGVKYTGHHEIGGINSPIAGSALSNSFVKILGPSNQKYFVGTLYDQGIGLLGFAGGIGLVGCIPVSDQYTQDVISAFNSGVQNYIIPNPDTSDPDRLVIGTGFLSGKVECNVGVLQGESRWVKILGILGKLYGGNTSNDTRSQLFATVKVNQSSLINAANRSSNTLCRDKRNTNPQDGLVCAGRGIEGVGDWSYGPIELGAGVVGGAKTLIVKNMDVIVPRNYLTSPDQTPIDLFIDGGNLILEQQTSTGNLKSFDKLGLIATTNTGYSSGEILKGNFIINGVVNGSGVGGAKIPHKLFIHGKFTSLNTIEADPNTVLARIHQLQNMSASSSNPSLYINTGADIELEQIFTWRCDRYGTGSNDGTLCDRLKDPLLAPAPLIIINQNYTSRLIQ